MKLAKAALGDNEIQGGTSIITFGSFGSGKSKLLQSWAINDFENGHLVILRSKDVDTWQDLASRYPIHVYAPDEYHFEFEDPAQNRNIKYTIIHRPDDIVKHLKRDEINVISVLGSEYAQGFFWAWFSNSLIHHPRGWTTFIFDEIRDVFQSHPSGPSYYIYEAFVSAMTSFRKKRIHFRASTHTFHDLYYEILYKFNYTVYLRNAILLPKKRTALKSRAPIREKADLEHYILDNISQFSVVAHDMLPPDLATGKTVSIEGPSFEPENFPLEMLKLGIQPPIECPECERVFHIHSTKQRCPFCKNEITITDRIAPGTPAMEIQVGSLPPSIDRGKKEASVSPRAGGGKGSLNSRKRKKNKLKR